MTALGGECEVILVDDGSTDGSFELMQEIHGRDPRIKAIRLSRNFGHQLAITAGLEHARGRAVIIMDADLQDPPEIALELAEKWREGYDVVYAVRESARRRVARQAADGEVVLPVDGTARRGRHTGRRRRLPARRSARARQRPRHARAPPLSTAACSRGSATTRPACPITAPPGTRARRSSRCARCSARGRRHRLVLDGTVAHRALARLPGVVRVGSSSECWRSS